MKIKNGKSKIIYLIGELGKGGSERQLFLLLKYIDMGIFEPHVVVFNLSPDATYYHEILRLGIPIYSVPSNCNGILKRSIFLLRLFRQVKPLIVHSWTIHDNPYAGIIGFISGIPFRFGSLRSSLTNKGVRNLPFILRKLCLYGIQYLFVNSQSILEELRKSGYPSKKIINIKNCVEILEPELLQDKIDFSKYGIPKDAKIICTVGNITPNKNIHIFIEALSKILPEYPDVYGVIIGQHFVSENDYYLKIRNMLGNPELDERIKHLLLPDNIPTAMASFYCVCLLSENEGTPNVILEAMAAARPVVASNIGGIPDIIDNDRNGILVPPGDIENVVKAMSKVLNDPDFAESLGNAGYELMKKKFSGSQSSRLIMEHYSELLEDK
jgi:glycosyltransferase involved in cell wall biosynthesis